MSLIYAVHEMSHVSYICGTLNINRALLDMQKEKYYLSKETYYLSKETYYLSKETYYLSKETYYLLDMIQSQQGKQGCGTQNVCQYDEYLIHAKRDLLDIKRDLLRLAYLAGVWHVCVSMMSI
jgi:hypothetical protein